MLLKFMISRILAICAVAVLFLPGKVHAQLIPCKTPGSAEELKIYIDDVRFKDATVPKALRSRLELLRNTLQQNLSATVTDQASVKLCTDRFPTDPSEFDTMQIDALNNQRVVLEVWASLPGQSGGRGEIGFVLVPAKSVVTPVVFVAREDLNGDVLKLVKKSRELQAFAPVVLGTRHYKNEEYESAVRFLCEGESKLQLALSGANATTTTPEQKTFMDREKTLLAQVQSMVDDSIRKAKATGQPQYAALSPGAGGRYSCPK